MAPRFWSLVLCGSLVAGAEAGAASHADQALDAITLQVQRLERIKPSTALATKAWQSAVARVRLALIRAQAEPPGGPRERERARERVRDLQRRVRALRAETAAPPSGGTGRIAGTVRVAATGAPLAGMIIYADRQGPPFFGSSAVTDAAGHYEIAGLPAGDYTLFADSADDEYVDELYDDIPCGISSCFLRFDGQVPEPILVSVADHRTVDGVDFGLARGGSVSGVVTDAATGAPLRAVLTFTLDETYANVQVETDANGRYRTGAGLPAGTYHGYAFAPGYITEYYDNIPCPLQECAGTPISVTLGATTAGIDFALDRGGAISGTVTAAETRKPVAGVLVAALSWPGLEFEGFSLTDAAGRYRVDGLPGGEHAVMSYGNEQGYLFEGYKDARCDSPCYVAPGVRPIAVKLGAERNHIDLVLDRGAMVSGRVVDDNTGLPLVGAHVYFFRLDIFDQSDGITDADGRYVTLYPLTPGSWAAFVSAPGYLSELYREVDCFPFCDFTKATPILADVGATIEGIDFTPTLGGAISGRVTDSTGRLPVPNAYVTVFDASGSWVANARVEEDGHFQSSGLPSGTYFALAEDLNVPWERRYVNQLYRAHPCPGSNCNPTSGTPVTVVLGQLTTGIDFQLTVGGKIGGRLTDAVTGAPIPWISVGMYESANLQFVGYGTTNFDGVYISESPLPRGEYLALTSAPGYVDELFDNVPCAAGCNAALGERIRVQQGRTTTDIDFALDSQP